MTTLSSAADELRVLLRTPASPPQGSLNNDGSPSISSPLSSSSSSSWLSPSNPAAVAHSALQRLRDSGDETFLFLRTMLEILPRCRVVHASALMDTEGTEELAFHCATGLRSVLLRRWDGAFGSEFRRCVRDWALCEGLGLGGGGGGGAAEGSAGGGCAGGERGQLPRTVSTALLGLAASAWKRGLADDEHGRGGISSPSSAAASGSGDIEAQGHLIQMMHSSGWLPRIGSFPELLRTLEALILAPLNDSASSVGWTGREHDDDAASAVVVASRSSSFLSLLLGEFAGTGAGGFGGYHMPLDFHARARSYFESPASSSSGGGSGALDEIMRIAMAALGGTVRLWTSFDKSMPPSAHVAPLSAAIVALNCDALGWDFGGAMGSGRALWEMSGGSAAKSSLVRPPERWRDVLIRPDFLGAVFAVYNAVRTDPGRPRVASTSASVARNVDKLAHGVRQLLLLLSSVTGNVFENPPQRLAYASFLVDGFLAALSRAHEEMQRSTPLGNGGDRDHDHDQDAGAETVDLCSAISRLVANFRVSGLSRLPSFPTLLGAVAAVGSDLLRRNEAACVRAGGDPDEWADAAGWRDEALGQLLEAAVLLADDPWLLGGGGSKGEEAAEAAAAASALASNLAPLYQSYVTTRANMARMEERFLAAQARELDEVREDIALSAAEEEATAASSLGRLDVSASVSCLGALLGRLVPQLQALMSAPETGDVDPDAAALLEETRFLVVCATHVLTDDCGGETPTIPEAVARSCASDPAACASAVALARTLLGLAEFQASAVSARPSDAKLSPFLAKTVLWFVRRWAPAYVLPQPSEYSGVGGSGIMAIWATPESASEAIAFCSTLCLHYMVSWPQEGAVQEEAAGLLLALGRRGKVARDLLVRAPSFGRIAALHSVTAGLRHNASDAEVRSAMGAAGPSAPPENMVRGYQRLPYTDRARILTSLLVGASEPSDDVARAIVDGCLRAVHAPFAGLVHALASKTITSDDVNAQETACLCVDLYGGVARSSEMAEPDRVPRFMTPSLGPLSGLMEHYASDLTVCERLLGLFRDYAEQFVAMLDREQCLALFHASAYLLKSYSAYHCAASRLAVRKTSTEAEHEEERSYNDVLCAIQLLLHLGTKDFIDVCATPGGSSGGGGVDSDKITEIIFFGLQQILPLMTQGLLQFPNLCAQYFSLVGFMMDTYPEKVCDLPYELFRSLLDSLLFGMSHADTFVSKASLRGIGGLAREHMKYRSLGGHLAAHPGIFDDCSRRLLLEVVFQTIVWDRLEPAGMALLPLAAVDVSRFAAMVASIEPQLGDKEMCVRVRAAFEKLIQPEILSKVASGGYEGRMNRLKFKKDFEVFVKDVHSFLIIIQ